MKTGVIYKLTCVKNNKFLYGSTINFEKRIYNYYNKLKNKKYGNSILQNCYNKYGKSSLIWNIVQKDVPENILTFVEDIWIGANCSRVEDEKKGINMRDASRGNFCAETRKKMSKWQQGRKLPQTHIDNMKKNHVSKKEGYIPPGTGLIQNIEKQILSSTSKLPILQFNLKGEFINKFNSQREAAKSLGNGKYCANICKCCKGIYKYAYGFIWKYDKKENYLSTNTFKIRLPIKVWINGIYQGKFTNANQICKKFNIGWNTIINILENNHKSKKYKFEYENM